MRGTHWRGRGAALVDSVLWRRRRRKKEACIGCIKQEALILLFLVS